MGIFNLFKGKKRTGTTLTDDDRRAGAEIRRINSEIRRAQKEAELEKARLELWKVQQDVADIRSQYEDDDEPEMPTDLSADGLLNLFLVQMLQGMQQKQTPTQPTHTPSAPIQAHTAQGREISRAEMAQIYESIPKAARKKLKTLDDAQLSAQIHSFAPDISPRSLQDCISFIREQ